jgi:hypothetical protein
MDTDQEDIYSENGEDQNSLSPPNSPDDKQKNVLATHLPVFARQSINLLTGSSNSGKTQLLLSILKNRQLFFLQVQLKMSSTFTATSRTETLQWKTPSKTSSTFPWTSSISTTST